jgi:hypothetical protein
MIVHIKQARIKEYPMTTLFMEKRYVVHALAYLLTHQRRQLVLVSVRRHPKWVKRRHKIQVQRLHHRLHFRRHHLLLGLVSCKRQIL